MVTIFSSTLLNPVNGGVSLRHLSLIVIAVLRLNGLGISLPPDIARQLSGVAHDGADIAFWWMDT